MALDWFIKEKRRNLYLSPSYYQRLLALPYSCRTATAETHASICNHGLRVYFSRNIIRKQDNYITMGIYRCSFLDMNMKLCENFDQSRISADKRFLKYVICKPTLLTPRPGAGSANRTLLAWSAWRSAPTKLKINFEIHPLPP